MPADGPDVTGQRHDPYAALRYPSYCIYAAAWVVSVLGQQIQIAAIAWEIYDRTGSKAQMGWIAGIQAIPLLLLALPAGQLADTFDRRRVSAISAIFAGACSIVLAFLSYRPGTLPYTYAFVFLNSVFLVLGRPARSAILPQIVPVSIFSNAVTWNSSIFQMASMIGPALAGKLIDLSLKSVGSVSLAYGVNAGCVITFAISLLLLRPLPGQVQQRGGDRSLIAGLRFILRNKVILATITLDLFAVLLGGATYLLPVYAKDILKVGPQGMGLLRAAEAAGALVMGMTIAHLPPMKRAGRSMLLAVAGFGAATIVFGISTNFWLSCSMLFLLGAFDNISVVVRHTLVQTLTPDPMRGRVSAVNAVFIGASNELGGLESGLTAELFGTEPAVAIGGIGTIATVATVASIWPQVLRLGSLRDVRPEPENTDPVEQAAETARGTTP